jgi:hypothetical protein
MAFWNDEFSGVGSIAVDVSVDNVSFTNVASGLMPTNHAPNTSYFADVFGLGGVQSARYVRLTVSDCPQPNDQGPYCGFGEVAFSASVPVPEPATALLLGLGIAGLGFKTRRKA